MRNDNSIKISALQMESPHKKLSHTCGLQHRNTLMLVYKWPATPHTYEYVYFFISVRWKWIRKQISGCMVIFHDKLENRKKNQQQIASRVLSTSSNKLRGGVCPFNYNILVYVNGDVLVINSWIFNPHICGVARIGIPCSDRRAAVSTRRRNVSVRGKSAETMSNLLTESKGKYWK